MTEKYSLQSECLPSLTVLSESRFARLETVNALHTDVASYLTLTDRQLLVLRYRFGVQAGIMAAIVKIKDQRVERRWNY